MNTILTIRNISKSYGPVQALGNISLDIPEGSVFGILGPNGSGKTTLLGILLDVLQADSGSCSWLGGIPKEEARKQTGALLETPNFHPYLSAYDNLAITASIQQKGMDNRDRVLEQLGLAERKNSLFRSFSLGMKQRLAIAAAMLGNPKILVLDEPTNGLDPSGIAEIRALIRQLNNEGITILMASHMLDEVEKVCSHVAILKKGSLLINGPVREILQSEDQIEVRAENMPELLRLLQHMPGISNAVLENGTIYLSAGNTTGTEAVNAYCHEKGIVLTHLVMKQKSLESRFIELTANIS